MVVNTVNRAGQIQDEFLAVKYGATPQDWESAADDQRFVEFIDGRLIMHSPVSLRHAEVQAFLQSLLYLHVQGESLGKLLSGPFTMDLGLERKFEPDVIFLSPRTSENLAEDRLIGPADLAIEIASPGTKAYDRGEKRECYRVGRVGEYWMIDPSTKTLILDRPAGNEIGVYSEGWVGSQTCPGFAVRAEWLWSDPLPNVRECLERIAEKADS